ncbi:MAG: hypothetical protein R6V46_04000 [Desulfatiglandaceae bacterium]
MKNIVSTEILQDIPVDLDAENIKKKLRMEGRSEWPSVQRLAEAAQSLIKARAVYKVCYIESKFEEGVVIEGRRLKSRVLRRNLEDVERVFPYVVTLGNEIEDRINECTDVLEQYYFDTIANVYLTAARRYLKNQLKSKFALDGMSLMSPGSLKDWGLEEQGPLFSILEDVDGAIGVRLTDTFLMLPRKSLSGIYFPTEVPFYSCQLCSRKNCPSRKAKYKEASAREYGILDPRSANP